MIGATGAVRPPPFTPSNWALVIGCDRYWETRACLRGGVRDALAMYDWLTDPTGGAVPVGNVLLLLSPTADGTPVPPGLPFESATNENIQKAHQRLIKMSTGAGERLFVHFSGHGLTGRVNSIDEPAIAPEDFDPELTDRALSIRSISEYFATTQIREQFFFFDACRSIPISGEFNIGQIARPRRSDYSQRAPEQYICYATSRGLKALETSRAGDERGVFTSALINGLRGSHRAKTWNRNRCLYTVTWNELFAHVEKAVLDQRKIVGLGLDGALMQEPRQTGEHGGSNPVLATFGSQTFAPEPLTLSIEPASAAPATRVTVLLEDADNDLVYGAPAPSPNLVHLTPRSYTVRARADSWRPRQRSWYVELYEPADLVLEFDPSDGAPPLPEAVGLPLRGGWDEPEEGRLIVEASDSTAIVEIHDEAGQLVAAGSGSAEVPDTGWFRIRVLTPNGAVADQRVELMPGERRTVLLGGGGPASPLAELMSNYSAFEKDFGGVHVAEEVGYVAAPAVTVLLALAAGVVVGQVPWGHHLRRLADAALPALVPGRDIHVVVVDGRPEPSVPTEIGVETYSLDEATMVSRTRLERGEVDVVTAASIPGRAGPHLVTVQGLLPGALSVPVHIIPRRPVMVVVDVDATGQTTVVQLCSALFVGGGRREANELRRFEAAQRFAAAGQIEHAWELMARAEPGSDPLADCFATYLRVRLGRNLAGAGPVAEFAEQTGLADAWLLDGLLASAQGRSARLASSAQRALAHGLPVFDVGLLAAADALDGQPLGERVDALASMRLPHQVVTALSGDEVPASAMALREIAG